MRQPGERLADRYVLQWGREGGMGSLYRAHDEQTGIEVAIKETRARQQDDSTRRRFVSEANVLHRIVHPQVPRVVDHFISDGGFCIVMEFIEGESLQELALSGAAPPRQVMDYALQVCGILHYLHTFDYVPLIHRDVKPGNLILRQQRSEVVLVDFGLACRQQSGPADSRAVAGTMGYAPREQLRGQAEPRTDVYGLGATMFCLLSGQPPPPLQVCVLPPELAHQHPALAAVIERATQADASLRFDSAEQMGTALNEILQVSA